MPITTNHTHIFLTNLFTRKATNNLVITFDIKHQEEVVLIPYNLIITGDNLMQVEECSHWALRCNYLCHTCKVGGTNVEKEIDKGYSDMFQVFITLFTWNELTTFPQCSELHMPKDTHTQIKHQIQLSTVSGSMDKVRNALSKYGIHNSATTAIMDWLLELGKVLQKRVARKPVLSEADITVHLDDELDALLGGQSLDDTINPLLGMQGLDIHKDTPMEILHTILLGVIKYFWGQMVYIFNKNHFLRIFQMQLESVNRDRLNSLMLNPNYILRYKNALVRKHFKSLAQVMPYLIYDLIPQTALQGWSVVGKLVVLLWHTSIEDIELYLVGIAKHSHMK